MLLSIIAFIVILSVLVFVHEFGHFIVAKMIGVKVEEFAFGFPPRLFGKKVGETIYSINAVPLGGYVRLAGEFGEEMLGWRQSSKRKTQNSKVNNEGQKTFFTKSVPARLAVILAGVVMNWLTAVVLITIGFMVGMAPLTLQPSELGGDQKPLIIVAEVAKNSAAEQLKLSSGDQLVSGIDADGKTVTFSSVNDLQGFTRSSRGRQVFFTIKRLDSGTTETKQVTLGTSESSPLGVALFEKAFVRLPFGKAITTAVKETWFVTRETVVVSGRAVGQLFQGQVAEEVGGPVLIYSATAQAVKLGFGALIGLASVLSINLAIINSIPFPALDGGRALFIILEGIFRKPILRQPVEQMIHMVGFALLIVLIIALTYRDILQIR